MSAVQLYIVKKNSMKQGVKQTKQWAALPIMWLLLCVLSACSGNEAERYWRENVENALYGKEYVNLRMAVDEYRLYDGVEFDRQPTDTVEVHLTPRGVYVKERYCYRLETEDSLFFYDHLDGNYTYGRTKNLKSNVEKLLYTQAYSRIYNILTEIIPFYLEPKSRSSFRLKKFSRKETCGDTTMLWYTTPWALRQRLLDGRFEEYGESNVVWVDDATGLVARAKRTTSMTIEGLAPEDVVVDVRFIDISFEEEEIDEGLYRMYPPGDGTIAFYNLNKEECSPSLVTDQRADNFDCFLDAPLVSATLDTVTLREIEGWVLVDIWRFGCRPCAEFVKNMKQEQDSLGYRILEREGISVVCLNPSSLVTSEFKAYTERYDIQDIAYSARAIADCVNWHSFPYYFLISPEKEIVFRDSHLGENYEHILDIKNNNHAHL